MMDSAYHVFRGLLGISCLIGLMYALSENRRKVNWRMIVSGILLQMVIAFVLIKVAGVRKVFEIVSSFFIELMKFSGEGAAFLFGGFGCVCEIPWRRR